MDTNFLNNVLSGAEAEQFQQNLALAKNKALTALKESEGSNLETLSGGLLLGTQAISKVTGLGDIALDSAKQIGRQALQHEHRGDNPRFQENPTDVQIQCDGILLVQKPQH